MSDHSCVIDGICDRNKTLNISKSEYRNVLDIPECHIPCDREELHSPYNACNISVPDVCDAMDKLKSGIGWDGIRANHIKYSGIGFGNLVCKFFNKILSHNYVPQSMMRGELQPVIKGSRLDRKKSDKYRPIMNSSMFFKVFEYTLLTYLERYIPIDSHQFAYRRTTGCLTAVTVLKETVLYYVAQGSSVYCTMVDQSKVYDRNNIDRLIRNLAVQIYQVKLLI